MKTTLLLLVGVSAISEQQKRTVECSLNGFITMKKGQQHNTTLQQCECFQGWKGNTCNELHLIPVNEKTKLLGYKEEMTSSWGGSIVQEQGDKGTNKYHMFVSRFSNHCGLDAWQSNSEIIHATTDDIGNLPFRYEEVLFPVFSHNPLVTRSPGDGNWVIFFEMADPPPCGYSTCDCYNGTTTDECNEMNDFDCPLNLQNWPSYMSYSKSLNGPWSSPQMIPIFSKGGDFNLSPIINADGSLYGLWRDGIGDPWVSHLRSFTAKHYLDVFSYRKNDTDIWPDLDVAAVEDPFLYRDSDDYYHAIFHDMQNECRHLGVANGTGSCGGHGFSPDGGATWHYSSDPLTFDGFVQNEDGTNDTYTRRERPHLVFDQENNILALSTAVMFGDLDESFTHLQFVAN